MSCPVCGFVDLTVCALLRRHEWVELAAVLIVLCELERVEREQQA